MRLGLFIAVGVSADSIISIGKVLSFTADTLLLTKDVAVHTTRNVCSAAFSTLPPDFARTILETYEDLRLKTNVLKIQYNVPDTTDAQDAAERYFKQAKTVASGWNERFESFMKPAQDSFNKFSKEFKSNYPESPELPDGLLDRLLVIFLLAFIYVRFFHIVWWVITLPCRIVRCICCSRKNGAKRPGRYSDKKKNK